MTATFPLICYIYFFIWKSLPTLVICRWKDEFEANEVKWATKWQNQQSDCAPSEDLDQPGHLPSMGSYGPKVSSCGQRRLIRLGGCPCWSESSMGAHAILLVLSCRGSHVAVSRDSGIHKNYKNTERLKSKTKATKETNTYQTVWDVTKVDVQQSECHNTDHNKLDTTPKWWIGLHVDLHDDLSLCWVQKKGIKILILPQPFSWPRPPVLVSPFPWSPISVPRTLVASPHAQSSLSRQSTAERKEGKLCFIVMSLMSGTLFAFRVHLLYPLHFTTVYVYVNDFTWNFIMYHFRIWFLNEPSQANLCLRAFRHDKF